MPWLANRLIVSTRPGFIGGNSIVAAAVGEKIGSYLPPCARKQERIFSVSSHGIRRLELTSTEPDEAIRSLVHRQ